MLSSLANVLFWSGAVFITTHSHRKIKDFRKDLVKQSFFAIYLRKHYFFIIHCLNQAQYTNVFKCAQLCRCYTGKRENQEGNQPSDWQDVKLEPCNGPRQ